LFFLTSTAETAGIIGSVISFLISFVLIKAFDKKAGSKSSFHPEIRRIVKHDGFYYEN